MQQSSSGFFSWWRHQLQGHTFCIACPLCGEFTSHCMVRDYNVFVNQVVEQTFELSVFWDARVSSLRSYRHDFGGGPDRRQFLPRHVHTQGNKWVYLDTQILSNWYYFNQYLIGNWVWKSSPTALKHSHIENIFIWSPVRHHEITSTNMDVLSIWVSETNFSEK